jgi:hypothetical protein
MRKQRLYRGLKFLPFAVAFFAAFGFVIMSLWNWLMPALFGLSAIGFWQALGLFVLARILFGGFRGGGGHWRHRIMERCARMTPEEREKFRQAFETRWGRVPPPDSTPAA